VRSLTDMHIFEESMSMVVVFHVYAQDYTRRNCMRRGLCYLIGSAVFIGLLTIFYIGYWNIG